jgi:arginine:ornithine antiporter/lysine permease
MTDTEYQADTGDSGSGASIVAKMTLPTLTAMVVGSMVGAGVFSLPARFGTATGVVGAVVAWIIAGIGMLMLAYVFQNLAIRKPDLDAGVFAYAKAGFGDYIGFNSAIGYWASACVGNTFYWVFIMTRRQGCRHHQPDRHSRQTAPDLLVHHRARGLVQRRTVPRELLGR